MNKLILALVIAMSLTVVGCDRVRLHQKIKQLLRQNKRKKTRRMTQKLAK